MNPKIVAVTGGSCSGKTTLIQNTASLVGPDQCQILFQDNYYHDQSKKFDGDGNSVNFDHPAAIDFQLLKEHLEQLKLGNTVQVPIYDFVTHTRKSETIEFKPSPIIIVDGILLLNPEFMRPLFDLKVFVECSEEIRLNRRVKRDTEERGRQREGVLKQFKNHVSPMHDQFVEPTKDLADEVITQDQISSFAEKKTTILLQLIENS